MNFTWLTRLFTRTPTSSTKPRWLILAEADIGFHETGNNRNITRFTKDAKCGTEGNAWCAIFANAQLERSGIKGTRSAMARSFEHSADFVKLTGPALGCIVTMFRGAPSSGQGHVFFYTGEDTQGVWGIGGNEDDAVRNVPHSRSRITGYWWPRSVALPVIGPVSVLTPKGSASTKET